MWSMNCGCDISRREFIAGTGMALAAGCVLGAESASGEPALEARWYSKLDKGIVACRLCPRECVVPPGKRGYCRVRENRNGVYYSLSYGHPVTVHTDPIEKKPFYHVYPGSKAYSLATVGCNIECRFCQNWEISQARPEDMPVPYTSPAKIASSAAAQGAKTIAFTYSEPTVFSEYVVDCAKAGRDAGVESIVITNGFITAGAQKDILPLVRAVKVDLKSFSQDFYEKVCSGQLQPVLDSLKRIKDSGTWYEIVVLLITGLNDNPDEHKRMAAWIVKELGPDVPVHFTQYHPAYKITNIPPTPVPVVQHATNIAAAEGCRYAYCGNVPGVGANTYCPSCKNLVVERYGFSILKDSGGKCDKCGAKIPGIWN